jgi:two-component system chemotaxis response regulator CheB
MPVSDAVDGTALRPGNVYLAPPDRHMIVGQERIHLSDGQHEKGRRPAVDPLLRSMAMTFGPRTIGVVLSGDLDDGVAGLLAVHRAGGVTVVQSPDDARCPGMPGAAVKAVPVDHVVPVSSMGALLARLARRAHADDGVERRARSRALCCPDCGGALVPDGVEQAMWAALRALEDRVSSRRRMAEHARSSRLPLAARGYEGSAAEDERRVQMLRSVLRNGG